MLCNFRSFLGDSTIGSANGVVKVLEICNDNIEDCGSWPVETKFDFEYMSNALGSSGKYQSSYG